LVFDYHKARLLVHCRRRWVTGHTYRLSPLANGATTLMFEGGAELPRQQPVRQVVDKHR